MFRSISLCAVALVVSAAPALAQTDAKPKPRASKPPAAIEISNQRQIKLTMFELATAGDNSRTIAKLAKPLDGGKKAKVALKGAKGCEFVARWQFEDAGDEAPVDLCSDPKIVLTD